MSEAIAKIDQTIERGIAAQSLAGRMERMLAVAGAFAELRERLTADVMKGVMALQGSALGFRTDKPYPVETVRDCLIEAALNGLHPAGNEWNIIGGRMYITKEGMARKLAAVPGLWYSITPGIPRNADGGAVVPMTVEWKIAGTAEKRELQICTKLNAGMGADAIIGKATRKARAWLYQHVTGQEIAEGDAAEERNVTPPAERELLRKPRQTKAEVVDVEPVANLDDMIAAAGIGAEAEAWAIRKHGRPFIQLNASIRSAIMANWATFCAEVKDNG